MDLFVYCVTSLSCRRWLQLRSTVDVILHAFGTLRKYFRSYRGTWSICILRRSFQVSCPARMIVRLTSSSKSQKYCPLPYRAQHHDWSLHRGQNPVSYKLLSLFQFPLYRNSSTRFDTRTSPWPPLPPPAPLPPPPPQSLPRQRLSPATTLLLTSVSQPVRCLTPVSTSGHHSELALLAVHMPLQMQISFVEVYRYTHKLCW
jgi:hypothetical protein